MATDRNKVIENYSLEEFRYSNPDESEIWIAKHRILKKNFTLKRVKYHSSQSESTRDASSLSGQQEWCYQNILRETNILKRLMCEMSPKCHKMIKTSNNLYVVYDQFPSLSLSEHLAKHPPSRSEKLALMLAIAKGLSYLHTRAIILLSLSLNNILLKDKNTVFFSDWSLARTVETQDKLDSSFLTSAYVGLPKELLEEGKCSYQSDIYSLGCVFQKVLRSGLLDQPSQIDKKLEQLISKMLSDKAEERPRLEEVLRLLQNYGADEPSTMVDSPKSQGRPVPSLKSIGSFRIKHTLSTPAELEDPITNSSFQPERKFTAFLETPKMNRDYECPSPGFAKSVKSAKSDTKNTDLLSVSSRKIESKKSFEVASSGSVNFSAKRKKEEERPNTLELIKTVNKKRNLAFFLLELSEFILRMWVCPELGYILLKYALLTLTSASDEWQRQDIQPKEKEDVAAILASERLKMSSNLTLLRENIMGELMSDGQVRREVEAEGQISDRFLKEKIIEFGKEMVVFCEQSLSDKSSLPRLVDCLFKTYMVLKKIEEGTYEKFWEKVYSNDYAFLHSQKYLKDQRQLGHRYLKSRIAEILRGK